MKKRFFKFIQVDTNLIKEFCTQHQEMFKYIDADAPFYVRIGIKPYPTLIHTIISEDEVPELVKYRLEIFSKQLKNHITPKRVNKISDNGLISLVGEKNAKTIRAITNDILNKKLNLKKLVKMSEHEISLALANYPNMNIKIIKSFLIFGCFKQNVLFKEENEFINGLKIFLNKNEILQEDIDNITKQYNGQLTLFSLCMFRINNEKAGK